MTKKNGDILYFAKPYGFIYEIKNLINNKKYIGLTTQKLSKRCPWTEHSLIQTHENPHLTNSLKKYGIENFERNVIDSAKDIEELDKKEEFYIQKYNTLDQNYGYNMKHGGNSGRHTKETKNKISQTRKEKGIAKGNQNPMYEKHHSEETKNKISQTKKKRGVHKGKNNHMYGKHHSKETKEKISKAMSGRKLTKEHKENISKGVKNKSI